MSDSTAGRYKLIVEEGSPTGGLFELEITTRTLVVDTLTGQTVLAFESLLEASLSTDSGDWADYRLTGVSEVRIDPGEEFVLVTYADGREESVQLPR